MDFTSDQRVAIQEFEAFLNKKEQVFILRGSAGTGKTTLLKEFINILGGRRNFRLMAPTGRAALILGKKTGLNQLSATIHKTIYGVEHELDSIDDFLIFKLKENTDPIDSVYFIDEASMVSDVYSDGDMFRFGSGFLLKDLFLYCNLLGSNRKIVFVGDYAQLPPVFQNISPALDADYLTEHYNVKIISSTLNEVVRQVSSSGIYQNSLLIRDSINRKEFNKFRISDSNDVCCLEPNNFIDEYKKILSGNSINDIIVITHSNSVALHYNKLIREIRYGSEQQTITAGDLLLITKNNYSNPFELFNGTIVTAEDVKSKVEVHNPFVGKEKVKLTFRKVTICGQDFSSFDTYILDDFLVDSCGAVPISIQKALWADFEQRMRAIGLKPKDESFRLRIKNDPYYNALQCKYGYAITCHKAQGGEWPYVFADMNALMGKNTEMYFRWAYTVVTRATKYLWHMSSPEFSAVDQFEFKPIIKCNASQFNFFVPDGEKFLDYRFKNIERIARKQDINCTESRIAAYQHIIAFMKDEKLCKLTLWYNNKSYSGKIMILNSNDADFVDVCKNICRESIIYHGVLPFKPKSDFQEVMHDNIMDIAKECDVKVLNIEQKDWSDIYYLQTEADSAYIEFFYNKKHIYTYAQPKSTLGTDDAALQNFIEHFN